jgi:hypothetical protein
MSNLAKKTRTRVIVIVIAVALLGSYIMFFTPTSGNPPFDFSDITKPEGSATVYQALNVDYINYPSRSIYPASKATTLTIVDTEVNRVITNIQTNLFINVNYDSSNQALTSWSFKADATVQITHSGVTDRQFTQQITDQGTSLEKNKDVLLTHASMTASDLEGLFHTAADTKYTFTSALRNIEIKLNYNDGTTETMNVISGSSNDLKYEFKAISMVVGP